MEPGEHACWPNGRENCCESIVSDRYSRLQNQSPVTFLRECAQLDSILLKVHPFYAANTRLLKTQRRRKLQTTAELKCSRKGSKRE